MHLVPAVISNLFYSDVSQWFMLLLFKEEDVWRLQAGGRFSESSAVTHISKSARALEEWQRVHTCAHVMGSSLVRITLHKCHQA